MTRLRGLVCAAAWGAVVVGGLYLAHVLGIVYCPIRRLTGLPCPTCGTVRGTLSLLSGDVCGAFARQPLGVAVVVCGAAVAVASVLSPGFRRWLADVVHRHRRAMLVTCVVAMMLNWAYVLVTCS